MYDEGVSSRGRDWGKDLGARLGGEFGGDFWGDRASPDLVVRPMLSVGSVRHHEFVRGRGLP